MSRGRCVVIQPFQEPFNELYDRIYEPAINESGFEPYRVDHDPEIDVPFEGIKQAIADSSACLADISINNPNVWFEVGYALAHGRRTCLVCNRAERQKSPFDTNQMTIIYYISSPNGFDELSKKIVARLSAIAEKQERVKTFIAGRVDIEKLQEKSNIALRDEEVIALLLALSRKSTPATPVDPLAIGRDMVRIGYEPFEANLALLSLKLIGLISERSFINDNNHVVKIVDLTSEGIAWVMSNKQILRKLSVSMGSTTGDND